MALWENGKNPYEAKKIGRQCRNYVESEEYVDFIRNQLEEGYYQLFTQNSALKDELLDTWPLNLVECGSDKLFAVGLPLHSKYVFYPKHHKGRNITGVSLMAVRTRLQREDWRGNQTPF